MKNLGTTIELDPKKDNITCPAFGLYSSPAEHSTMGHIVLDLTNLASRPTTKSCEQLGHLKKHVTFAMSERRPAYPAHALDMDEDEDEDDKTRVWPASRKDFAEEKRDPATDDEDLQPLVPPRLPSAATLEHEVPKDSRERAEDTSIFPRPERSRVSGLRAEEFGDLIFLNHGSAIIGDKTFGFLIMLDGATSHWTAYPCKKYFNIGSTC